MVCEAVNRSSQRPDARHASGRLYLWAGFDSREVLPVLRRLSVPRCMPDVLEHAYDVGVDHEVESIVELGNSAVN